MSLHSCRDDRLWIPTKLREGRLASTSLRDGPIGESCLRHEICGSRCTAVLLRVLPDGAASAARKPHERRWNGRTATHDSIRPARPPYGARILLETLPMPVSAR